MKYARSMPALLILGGLLTVSLAAEIILHAGMNRKEMAGQLRTESSYPAESNGVVEADYTAKLDKWVTGILERPLFRVDRKPVISADAEDDAANGSALPRLSGVISFGANRLAVFQPASGGHLLVQREGSRIGQWSVESIMPDRVVLRGPDGTRELRPHSDHVGLPGDAIDNPSPGASPSLLQAQPTIPPPSAP